MFITPYIQAGRGMLPTGWQMHVSSYEHNIWCYFKLCFSIVPLSLKNIHIYIATETPNGSKVTLVEQFVILLNLLLWLGSCVHSSVSSAVNSLAAMTLEDFIKPLYKAVKHTHLPEQTATRLTIILCKCNMYLLSLCVSQIADQKGDKVIKW